MKIKKLICILTAVCIIFLSLPLTAHAEGYDAEREVDGEVQPAYRDPELVLHHYADSGDAGRRKIVRDDQNVCCCGDHRAGENYDEISEYRAENFSRFQTKHPFRKSS